MRKPCPQSAQRARAKPWARMAPALVPTTRSGRIPACSNTLITPICAKPRAEPPESTSVRPRGAIGRANGAAIGTCVTAGISLGCSQVQPASAIEAAKATLRRTLCPNGFIRVSYSLWIDT